MGRSCISKRQFHLDLILKNCAGDISLTGVQENNRRAEESTNHFSLNTILFLSRPIWNCSTHFHEYIPTGTEFKSRPSWSQLEFPNGTVSSSPMGTRGPSIPGMSWFQLDNWNWSYENVAFFSLSLAVFGKIFVYGVVCLFLIPGCMTVIECICCYAPSIEN